MREDHNFTVGSDDLHCANCCRKVAVIAARAMRGRGACANYGEVRQRRKIMDCESAAVDVRCKLPISDTGSHCDSSCLGIEFDLIEVLQRYLIDRAVGDAIEGVTCSKSLEMRVAADAVQNVFEGIRLVEILSAVGVISGPICTTVRRRLRGGEFGKQSTGKHSPRGLEKLPFIHCELLLRQCPYPNP